MLHFEGGSLFRHHLVCSTLSKRPITLTHLHDTVATDYNSIDVARPAVTGIQDYEVNFLKFLTRVTSGSKMQLQHNNTTLVFEPGMILGGSFVHEVPTSRSVTYIVEAALLLLPFAKYDSKITLVGATQGSAGDLDLSPDTLRTVTTRWMQLFGVHCGIRILRRGAAPGGGGAVELTVRAVRRLTSAVAKERGRVRRVRGIAYACRTAGDLPQRAATAAKGVLLGLLPDVYVVTDMDRGEAARKAIHQQLSRGEHSSSSTNNNDGGEDADGAEAKGKNELYSISGYGVLLVAETTSNSCVLSQEAEAGAREPPEEVGARAARLLLDQLYEGGCADSHHQLLLLLLMALAPDEVNTLRFGALTSSAVSAFVLMERYFQVRTAVKEEESFAGAALPPSTLITCLGSNMVNVWKKSS